MKLSIFAALVAFTACAPSPAHTPKPDAIWDKASPATLSADEPKKQKSITLVSLPGCKPCAAQKALIKDMISKGELKGVSYKVISGSTPEYPASLFPTLYICSGKSCKVAKGYQSRNKLLGLLK